MPNKVLTRNYNINTVQSRFVMYAAPLLYSLNNKLFKISLMLFLVLNYLVMN